MPAGQPTTVEDAHRSRHGRAHSDPSKRHNSLADRDIQALLKEGFFPSTDLLTDRDLEFRGMDELIQEHERHLEQIATTRAAVQELHARFRQEDAAREAALRQAYVQGSNPAKVPPPPTPADERNAALAEAERQNRLAHEVAFEWATDALEQARARTTNWESTILESQAGTRTKIEALNEQLDALKAELRKDESLQNWVNRLNRPVPGTLLPFSAFAAMTPPPPRDPSQLGPYGQIAHRQALAARGLSLDQGA
jgi:hypothetical protein